MNDARTPKGSDQPNRGPDIARLLALLESATAGSASLDAQVWLAIGGVTHAAQRVWAAPIPLEEYALLSIASAPGRQYTRNLTAAISLVPKHERGGWFWRVGYGSAFPGWAHLNKYHPDHCDLDDEITARAATPELAVCIAALRANAEASKSVPSLSPAPARGASSPESSLPESNNQSETP